MAFPCAWQEPNLDRSAVPDATWQADPDVYGVKDVFLHEVPLIEFGPLRAFGSLQQLRNTIDGGANAPEDYTYGIGATIPIGDSFKQDREERYVRSVQYLFKDRVCDPEYKYTIEDAVGNPPYYDGTEKTDASSADRKKYDMHVPNKLLGESAVERRVFKGCGLGSECEDEDPPNFEESSLYQFVYVTSSHDPDVQPGWHRLIHLTVWADRACNVNVDQTCRSYLDPVVQRQIYDARQALLASQGKFRELVKNALGLGFITDPITGALKTAASGITKAANEVGNAFKSVGRWFGRRLEEELERGRMLRYRKRRRRRRDRNNRNGYYNIRGEQDSQKQVERDAEAALIAAEAAPKIIRLNLNADETEVQATTFRTGRQMLFATRCSDFLHKRFPTEIACCDPVSTCNPPRPYKGLFSGDQCSQRPLELADARTQALAQLYLDRLATPSPPPLPPPSPNPPPPPSPPSPPPPPAPPVAVTADQAKELILNIERSFCDSVRDATANTARLVLLITRSFRLPGVLGFGKRALFQAGLQSTAGLRL